MPEQTKKERGLNKIVAVVLTLSVLVGVILLITLPKDKNETSSVNVDELANQLGEPTAADESATGTDGEVKGVEDTLINPTENVDPEVLAEVEKINAEAAALANQEVPEVQEPSDADKAKGRDEQRLKDVEEIRQKLEEYKKAKGNYPEKLDELKGLPKDPSFTDERAYGYTVIGKVPALYYDLSFVTESEKITFNGVELERGYHVSTPDASPLY